MADETTQLDHVAFLQRFRQRALQRGHDTSALDDEQLIARIGAKSPEVGDQLRRSWQTKVLKESIGDPTYVEGLRKIGAQQRENAPGATVAGLAARVLPGLALPGWGDVAGEGIAQKMEGSMRGGQVREGVNYPTMVTQGLVGALPWQKLNKMKKLGTAIQKMPGTSGAIKGAISSGIGSGAYALTEEGRLPTAQEMVLPIAAGGVIGGVANKVGPHVLDWLSRQYGETGLPLSNFIKQHGTFQGVGAVDPAAKPPVPPSPGAPPAASPQPPPLPFSYANVPAGRMASMSTEPPAMPPGFAAEALVRNPNAGVRAFNEGGPSLSDPTRQAQMALPGMPIPDRFAPLRGETQAMEQALQGTPEGQALFRFMQEGNPEKAAWRQKGISRPVPAAPPEPPAPGLAQQLQSLSESDLRRLAAPGVQSAQGLQRAAAEELLRRQGGGAAPTAPPAGAAPAAPVGTPPVSAEAIAAPASLKQQLLAQQQPKTAEAEVVNSGDMSVMNPSPSVTARLVSEGYTPGEKLPDGSQTFRYGKPAGAPPVKARGEDLNNPDLIAIIRAKPLEELQLMVAAGTPQDKILAQLELRRRQAIAASSAPATVPGQGAFAQTGVIPPIANTGPGSVKGKGKAKPAPAPVQEQPVSVESLLEGPNVHGQGIEVTPAAPRSGGVTPIPPGVTVTKVPPAGVPAGTSKTKAKVEAPPPAPPPVVPPAPAAPPRLVKPGGGVVKPAPMPGPGMESIVRGRQFAPLMERDGWTPGEILPNGDQRFTRPKPTGQVTAKAPEVAPTPAPFRTQGEGPRPGHVARGNAPNAGRRDEVLDAPRPAIDPNRPPPREAIATHPKVRIDQIRRESQQIMGNGGALSAADVERLVSLTNEFKLLTSTRQMADNRPSPDVDHWIKQLEWELKQMGRTLPRPGQTLIEDGVPAQAGMDVRAQLEDLAKQYGQEDLLAQLRVLVGNRKGGAYQQDTNLLDIGVRPAMHGTDVHTVEDKVAHEFRHAIDTKENPDLFKDYPTGQTRGNPNYYMHPAEVRARGESNIQGFQRESDAAGQLTLPREEIIRPIAESTDRGRMQRWLDEQAIPPHARQADIRLDPRRAPEQGLLPFSDGPPVAAPAAPQLSARVGQGHGAGNRGSTPIGDVGDIAALAAGGLAGATQTPEDPWEGGLIGAAAVFAAKRGLGKLAGVRKSHGKVINEALEAWKVRGKSIPADDTAATEAWMRDGRELLDSQIGNLGNSIQDVAKNIEAGIRLRHPDAFTGKVGLVEGVTPTGQQFIRQEPVSIPKNDRILPGNIPLSRLDNIGLNLGKMPQEVVPGLQTTLNELSEEGALQTQRRGVQPIKMIEQLASRVKVRVDKPGEPGTAYNSEEILALANTLVGAQSRVDEMAAKMGTAETTPMDEARFAEALLQRNNVELTLSGAAAEAGRSQRALQVVRNVMEIGNPELIQRAIREAGGESRLRYIAKELAKMPDDIDARRARLNELLNDGTVRYLERAFQVNLLSSVKLHALNTISNSFNTFYRVAALPGRATVGSIQGALGKPRGFDWSAVNPAALALHAGAQQGLEAAHFMWKHGVTPGQGGGMLGAAQGLNSGRFDVPMPEFQTSGYGPLNPVNAGYNKVLRALGAADQFFSVLNTHSARVGISTTVARNEARAQGLTGEKLNAYMTKRVPEIIAGEDLTIETQALNEGRMAVGQEDMGTLGNWLLDLRQKKGSGFLVPFIKTTLNFARQGIEMSPAAPLSGQWRDAALRNPQTEIEAVRQAEALGRTIMGTMALSSFAMAKQAGYLNLQGAMPKDPVERAKFINAKRQPYSIELEYGGNKYAIPFRALGPLSIPLGGLADFYSVYDSTEKESDKIDLLRRFATNFAENTAFGNMMDLAETVTDPRKILNYVAREIAATATPGYGLLNDVARGQDQTLRESPQGPRLVDELGWRKGLSTITTQQMPVIGEPIQKALNELIDGTGEKDVPKKIPLMGPLGEPSMRFTPEWVPPALRFAYHATNPIQVSKIEPELGEIQPIGRDWQIGPKASPNPKAPKPIDLNLEKEHALRQAKGEATAKLLERLERDPRYRALSKAEQQMKRDALIRTVRAREASLAAAQAMKEQRKAMRERN